MLEVREVHKSYYGRTVLQPVSFTLNPGECLGIMGTNGSGKSTLLSILAQAEKADGGDILMHGQSVIADKTFLRSKLGYVPQENALAEDLTVAQQISLWQAACGRRGALPEEISALLGLDDMMHKRIRELSGGMRQRVSIALALSSSTQVLVMDEATSGLDKDYCNALLDWLEQYLKNGGCIVWCSHHQDELNRLCSRCMHLKDGEHSWIKE